MWTPENGLWRPSNLAEVWARGTESSLIFGQNWTTKHGWSCNVRHHWTIARRQDQGFQGYQLLYTPIHQAAIGLSYQWQNLQIRYQQEYVGRRYLDNLNQLELPPYQLGQLAIYYQYSLSDLTLDVQLHINNLWGVDYQVVASRPMPLQQLELSILIRY